MNKQELQKRTKDFALRTIRLIDSLPRSNSASIIGRQLLRSATSVGANYRSACRGRSKAEFIAKLGIALEEADESQYWLELLIESKLISQQAAEPLLNEANQLVAILTASSKTARANQKSAIKNQKFILRSS
ncbi:MAG: four helix bundle protein [Anaerolineales bacterium]|nr:four helix bundle protein [Anaerolineales bacterium]